MTALLILQGLIFALWAATAFRILFHLRARGEARTGQMFPGPVTFLSALRDWLSDPAEAKWRRDLVGLSVMLVLLTLAIVLSTAG
ncbi:MAG: hypothetical protein JJT81_03790 [Rubellimicrobium sp.]|nr:hypothetical protein [Rubellimicrobium sp.]